ncbi:hypothetical protein Hanom_Chr11g01017031 [Helianthus anomalus]
MVVRVNTRSTPVNRRQASVLVNFSQQVGPGHVRRFGSSGSVNSVDPVNSVNKKLTRSTQLTQSTRSGGLTFRHEDSVKNFARKRYLR